MATHLIIEGNFLKIGHHMAPVSHRNRVVGSAGSRAGNRLGNNPELHQIAPRNTVTRGFDLRWGCQRRSLTPNGYFGEKMVPRTGIEPVTRGFSMRIRLA
jgi:hypothetical protein